LAAVASAFFTATVLDSSLAGLAAGGLVTVVVVAPLGDAALAALLTTVRLAGDSAVWV
jgi:hypothetical protein